MHSSLFSHIPEFESETEAGVMNPAPDPGVEAADLEVDAGVSTWDLGVPWPVLPGVEALLVLERDLFLLMGVTVSGQSALLFALLIALEDLETLGAALEEPSAWVLFLALALGEGLALACLRFLTQSSMERWVRSVIPASFLIRKLLTSELTTVKMVIRNANSSIFTDLMSLLMNL